MKFNSLLITVPALLASLTLAATPAEEMLAAAEKTVDGLVAMAEKGNHTVNDKGKKVLDPVAYEAILLACQDLTPNKSDYSLYGNPQKALGQLRKTYLLPPANTFIPRLLEHPSPNVRAVALGYITSFLGVSEANLRRTNAMLTNEKEPVAIAALIRALANEGDRRPEIGAFLVRCLDHQDPVLRRLVAIHSCSSWNFKNQALADKLANLIVNEKDTNTRIAVCNYAGKLNNDAIVEAYGKILFTEKSPAIINSALYGLVQSWWYFPLYNTNRQKAYELTLKFFREYKPTTQVPNTTALSPLTQKTTNARTITQWQEQATWYKAEDVAAVFLPYATDKAYPDNLRVNAIKILGVHGYTKAQIEELVAKLTADKVLRPFDARSLERFLKDMK